MTPAVFVIVVFGMLHNVESVMPGSYPDLNSCQSALATTHFAFPHWGECQLLASKPMSKLPAKPAPAYR
jgi:hypothetical protein